MLKVLHITNAFPYHGHPEYGCFIKEQITSVDDLVSNKIIFINAHKKGKKAYIQHLSEVSSEAQSADVIHCHHLFSLFVLKLSGVRGKPVVLSFLNDWTKEVKLNIPEFAKKLLCQIGCKLADQVIFKSFIPDFLKGDKFSYLPNGVDEEYFHIMERSFALDSLNLDRSATYVLFVSSKNLYRHQKRYDLFQSTMVQLKELNPSKNYQALTMSTDDRKTALLKFNASSVHFLSSDYEGSPNSVKEALCCGIQVVTREAGSVRDLVSDVPGCVVVDSEDPHTLAYTIDKNLANQVIRKSIREEFLKKNITRSSVSKSLVSLYSKAASFEGA